MKLQSSFQIAFVKGVRGFMRGERDIAGTLQYQVEASFRDVQEWKETPEVWAEGHVYMNSGIISSIQFIQLP